MSLVLVCNMLSVAVLGPVRQNSLPIELLTLLLLIETFTRKLKTHPFGCCHFDCLIGVI